MVRQLAWRNIWRNRRRSLITLSAMTFGLVACLVTFAIGDGSHLQMMKVATSTYLGHVQINQVGFQKLQKIDLVVGNKAPIVKQLAQVDAAREKKSLRRSLKGWQRSVQAWTPRVFGAGLISTGSNSSGGYLLGLDLVRESRVTRLSEIIFKAMARESVLTGHLKERIPKEFREKLAKQFAALKKELSSIKDADEVEKEREKKINRILHNETQKLVRDRKRFEAILSGLLKSHEIVIGKGLALTLGAKVGTFLAAVTPSFDGSIGNDRYKVVAIVESGSEDMDISLCILPIRQLQELLVLEEYYHSLILRLDSHQDFYIRKVARLIQRDLRAENLKLTVAAKKAGGKQKAVLSTLEVQPWQKISPELYEFIRADEAGQYMMVLIVFFLVGFIILNTFQMSIMERTREFGVLKSIGMKNRRLIGLLLWEGFFLGMIAIVAGLILGVPLMAYLESVGIPLAEPMRMGGIVLDLRLEAKITIQGLLFSPGIVLLTTLTVSLFPALQIARMKPVEALRHT